MKKKHILLLGTLPILLLAILASNIPVQAQYPTPYVKMYVNPGTVAFVAPGGYVNFYIKIETYGIPGSENFPGNTTHGIVGWGLNLQVDPNVLDIDKAAGASIRGEYTSGYFLWDFADWHWHDLPTFLGGAADPVTGFWRDISAQIMPSPDGGAGDYFSPDNICMIRVISKSDTQPCLIDIVRAVYFTPDGNYHPVDIVVDGFYGAQPTYMSETTGVYDPTSDPTGTTWHEDYPNYCKMWAVTLWTDNGDQRLSASDQLEMMDETGSVHAWHVDAVTTTIHWTFKLGGEGVAEPNEVNYFNDPDLNPDYPIGSTWHQIYPDYCRWFTITSWEDNGVEPGIFDPSDQFDFVYEDEPGATYYAHLDAVTTDITLSYKGEVIPEFPLGLGLMIAMAPAIPLVYLWRLRRKVTKK